MTPNLRIFAGTSGWAYPTWKLGFYPPKLPAKKFLNYYASQLNSVEVNYTFRQLPKPAQLLGWIAEVQSTTPPGASFRFSFKAHQRITHFSRLRDCDTHVAELFASLQPAADAGVLGLVLFQLPPNFKTDLAKLGTFLDIPCIRAQGAPKIAFEFRHDSWFTEETYALLRQNNAALCIAETDDLTTPEVHTASTHTSFRLRKAGGYSEDEVAAFAQRFRALATDRDIYVYFKHEDDPTGALNARSFLQRVCE